MYTLFSILAFYQSVFLSCLDTIISCYILFERLKFEVFKTEKTGLRNLNDEKYRQSENEEFEAFERIIILLLYTFFKKKIPIDKSHYCLTKVCWKTF